MATPRIVQIRQDRIDKLDQLAELGFPAYPSTAHRTHYTDALLEDFDAMEGQVVTVAGRMMAYRSQGNLTFADLQDQQGKVQLFVRKKSVGEPDPATGNLGFENLRLLDLGDIIEATGTVMRTKRGEISVDVTSVRLLTKTLRPLPDKWAGLKDRERILRQRYLHHTMEPEKRATFDRLGKLYFAVRQYLYERGFIEVHTPILQSLYGGGTARPFLTHLNALHQDMYLSISHELYLKRMIAAGFDKVFTIGRYFRNEGIDSTHHPEFSMIETMTAYENYEYNMDLVEGMFRFVSEKAYGRTTFDVRGVEVDFAKPWARVNMADAVLERFGHDFRSCPDVETANGWLKAQGVPAQGSIGEALFRLFDDLIGPTLLQPTFVYGHPIEISPLAKPLADDPRYVERFELVIGGIECGDNWSEQNDPRKLLETWRKAHARSDVPADERHPLDYSFVEMLEHGMPPTTGIGPGIERMAMIFEGTESIDDVIYFPMMRPEPPGINAVIFGEEAGRTGGATPATADGEAAPAGLSLTDLAALVQVGALSPAQDGLVLLPRLTLWGSKPSGSVVIRGLRADGPVVVSGVAVAGDDLAAWTASLSAETQKLVGLLEKGLRGVTVSVRPLTRG